VIDAGLPREWPEAVRDACRMFRQGHLIEHPPFLYVANPAHAVWELTRTTGDPGSTDDLLELEESERPPFGMIVTETCDLGEEDAKAPRIPWITISPVYDLAGVLTDAQVSNLRSNRVKYMRLLSGPLPTGLWVADFRLEVPLEKSILVDRMPIEAFETEGEYADLARCLAGRRNRPVVSSAVNKALITHLRRWIEGKPDRASTVLNGVVEVRVLFSGSSENPDAVALLVVGDREPIAKEVREMWEEKWTTWHTRLEAVAVPLLATTYTTLDECSARQYSASYPVDLSFDL
jgi:hypothetical protein